MSNDPDSPAWHAISVEDALERLDTRHEGLSKAEASRRLAEQGPNRLSEARRESFLRRLFGQFTNTLVLVLVGAAAVMLLIGELLDAAVVGALVVVNALIGFIQEGRAERALEAVRRAVAPEAIVIRDGEPRTVGAEEVVCGDIVALAAGSLVPADLRLVETRGLEIEEAALTGESVPVGKGLHVVAVDSALADRIGMAWSGTTVARGVGRGVVVATGDATEIGRIGRLLARRESRETPLSRQLSRFSRRLTMAILLLAGAVYAIGAGLRDMGAVETFRAAVGIAIAAVREALPAILTFSLAVGVTRMARRRAVIRKLPAVEALGSVDIICADKTGTITRNQLTVATAVTSDGRFEIGGTGLEIEGAVKAADDKSDPRGDAVLGELGRGAVLANDASLRRDGDCWQIDGDLTDGALLIFAAKLGLDPMHGDTGRLSEIPYEADQQYMASLNRDEHGSTIWLKGAPERVFDLCAKVRTAGGEGPFDRDRWEDVLEQLADAGHRVLAVARRPTSRDQLDEATVEEAGFTLLGLIGMIDPARPEVRDSIATARSAGIEVKMITGDHPATARAIAASVGLEGETIAGPELDALDEDAFAEAASRATIIARATPEHKQRLIGALQDRDKSIAMTGDGFNDAPALHQADIGVAMGGRGTEAAREASDIVLTDDNFASIVAAVREGRTVYENIRKAVVYILPTSFGEAGLIILAVILGQALPITALQILWINLVTEATLSVAIAFDPAEPDIMRRRPRRRGEPLLTRFLIWRIAFVAGLMTLAGWYLFEQVLGTASIETARTVVVNGLVACEIGYLLNCRRLRGSALGWRVLTGNHMVLVSIASVIALQLLFTYASFMHGLFGSTPLGWGEWGLAALFGLLLFLLVEGEKLVTRRFGSNHP